MYPDFDLGAETGELAIAHPQNILRTFLRHQILRALRFTCNGGSIYPFVPVGVFRWGGGGWG